MYGDNYGYRSGLNASMVEHLTNKITSLENLVQLNPNDIVIDIGSNDGVALKPFKDAGFKNVESWEVGKTKDWEGTLVVTGTKK